ncbi:MAG: SGNH/GDSL hydrolase family protein, partial [Planctomycetes bacterium]|nr:SGNH/GDSL hydrolase family protein [Planctomycetota bacterium]
VHAGAAAVPPLCVANDHSYLFSLNPEHPEVSAQGLRRKEVAVPKPENTFRILVLGDSVVFGEGVAFHNTFSSLLEAALQEAPGRKKIEVINAGVNGYSPFNELHYYLEQGRKFEPDLVVTVFCMNDVANPRLHWNAMQYAVTSIPEEAIPNTDYDRDKILPIVHDLWEAEQLVVSPPSLLMRSKLFSLIYRAVKGGSLATGRTQEPETAWYAKVEGRRWPTFITGEDSLSIRVLMDDDSREWRWLCSIYDQLNNAVQQDHVRFVLLLAPLSYQLEEGYPFVPQERLIDYCKERDIPCLDLLPIFRARQNKALFFGQHEGYLDIWHLNEEGHRVVSEALQAFLQGNDLLP